MLELNIMISTSSAITSSSHVSPSISLLSISPRGTGAMAGGERGALCFAASDPGVHSERGEMLTQLCPARHCQRSPSILCLLNRAPTKMLFVKRDGGGRITYKAITHDMRGCMRDGCVAPLAQNSRSQQRR